MELTPAQGRVLGALVEKERTTPQAYPLTENALLAACNQTTSRDPVVSYDTATVRLAVRELRELGLLRTVHRSGERSDKHRHELEPALGLSAAQVSLLAVLLLRGPQTLAELRSRSERLHPFASVDEVEQELAVMADRDEPLVGLLPRQPGRKEARFTQLLVPSPATDPDARAEAAPWPQPPSDRPPSGEPPSSGPPSGRPPSASQDAGPDAGEDTAALATALAQVVEDVAALRQEVDELREALERATGG